VEENRKLALIVSFYLSKFDRKALENLGFTTFTQAFKVIGEKLNVPPNTIKNMRENFDPLHPNGRVGWYQRELAPSRLDVLENYSQLSEMALTEIVKEILANNIDSLTVYSSIINNDQKDSDNNSRTRNYTTRGITGNRAEELFVRAFMAGQIDDFYGNLRDRRNDGCGYDFELVSNGNIIAFEVKGLLDKKGGVNFTDKEWNVASELGENYILVLISNIKENPTITLYKDPYNTLTSQKRILKTIAINWSVPSDELFS